MAIALNMTGPLKQDPQSQETLRHLVETFSEKVQPAIDAALARSELVHYARVLVVDNKYIQVITEFDGTPEEYTEFFRTELNEVFHAIFSLIDGAPDWDELNNPNDFFEYSHGLNLKALGTAPDGSDRGYLFSAVGDATIREIKDALAQRAGGAP